MKLLLTMGMTVALLGCGGCKKGRFFSAESHRYNMALQEKMTPETIAQLRGFDVSPDTELRLEFFFYTNTAEKAEALERALKELGYSASHGRSASGDGTFVITGWTTRMKMSDLVVVEWVRTMCELGFEHDAEFDGWGTNPYQDDT